MTEYFSDVKKEISTALMEKIKRQSELLNFEEPRELFVEQEHFK